MNGNLVNIKALILFVHLIDLLSDLYPINGLMQKVFSTMLSSVAFRGKHLSIRCLVLGSSVYLKEPPKNLACLRTPPHDLFLLLPLRFFQEHKELLTWLDGCESARPECLTLFLGNQLPFSGSGGL